MRELERVAAITKATREIITAINKYKQSLNEAKMSNPIKPMTRVEVFLCPRCEGAKGSEDYVGSDGRRVYTPCQECGGSGLSFLTDLQRNKSFVDALPKEGDWVRCDVHRGYFKVARRDGLFLLMKNKFGLALSTCQKVIDPDMINSLERGMM
jgi:transcription elongation factor Elf1